MRHLVMLFGLLVVSGVFAAMFGGRSESSTIMPGSLLGIWRTTVPKYAGRFFEISTDIVVFATGDGETAVHPIASVEMVPEGQRRLYTVIQSLVFTAPAVLSAPHCAMPARSRTPRSVAAVRAIGRLLT